MKVLIVIVLATAFTLAHQASYAKNTDKSDKQIIKMGTSDLPAEVRNLYQVKKSSHTMYWESKNDKSWNRVPVNGRGYSTRSPYFAGIYSAYLKDYGLEVQRLHFNVEGQEYEMYLNQIYELKPKIQYVWSFGGGINSNIYGPKYQLILEKIEDQDLVDQRASKPFKIQIRNCYDDVINKCL